MLQEALLIYQLTVTKALKSVQGPGSIFEAARVQDELAFTLYCLASVKYDAGELDEALRMYAESMQHRLASDSTREKKLNAVHCAMSLVGMGNVYLQFADAACASKAYAEALRCCQALGTKGLSMASARV